ncbi:MAG TPA: Calx-beta domain-containing protein, partial [Herpetosiphonaceae bacterium]|nr:Calx-beta domain-containing protein [Herpetosiphonaceae bacterium]
TPAFGQTVTYSIAVSHAVTSTADAYELIITDTLPLGLDYVPGSASLPPADVDESGAPVIVFRIPTLSLGGDQTFTYQATVGAPPAVDIGDTLSNTASLTWTSQPGTSPDERTGTAAAAETVTVTGVDLALGKTAQPASALPGAAITYTLAFTNQGNLTPASIVLTDTIPSQLTGAAFTSSGATVADTGFAPAYVWSISGLAPGQTGYITVTGTLDPAITANQTITNTATIAASGDLIPGNDSASAAIAVIAPSVRFISSGFNVLESAGNAVITVEINVPNPISDVTVNYATSNGTALAGSDYIAATGTITIPRGQTSATFLVGLLNDTLAEPTESLTLTLSNARGAALGAPSAATLSLFNATPPLRRVYLPLIIAQAPQPDLVVDSVSAAGTGFSMVIRNQGAAPVTAAFWVDAYINPAVAPTQANQPWNSVGSFGLVWGVNGAALPLDPGETLTLTRGGQYYAPQHSTVPSSIPAGSRLYAHADSFGQTSYAAVLESHEANAGPYNNILGRITSAALSFGADPVGVGFDPGGLPERTR